MSYNKNNEFIILGEDQYKIIALLSRKCARIRVFSNIYKRKYSDMTFRLSKKRTFFINRNCNRKNEKGGYIIYAIKT